MFPPNLDDLWKTFNPPAELNRATPRETALTGGGIGVIIFGLAFVIFAAGISITLRMQAEREQHELDLIAAQGRLASATIAQKWRTGGKSPSNMASYEFEVDGRSYTGRSSFSRAQWDDISEGTAIDVRYLASDPSQNFPVISPIHPAPWWATLAMAPVFLIAPAIFAWQFSRERNLVRDGTPAPGVVTGNRRAKNNRVEYEFALLGGGRAKGRFQRSSMDVGSLVCVLYDPQNPNRNILYPPNFIKARAPF